MGDEISGLGQHLWCVDVLPSARADVVGKELSIVANALHALGTGYVLDVL